MKRAILLVAYGPGSARGRAALQRFDARARAAFPGFAVRWAYSSPLMRRRLEEARQKSDSVAKALRRLRLENFDDAVVQPLQLIRGREYEQTLLAAGESSGEGFPARVGAPLLDSDEDVAAAADILPTLAPAERRAEEDVILMGHGSRHPSAFRYAELAAAAAARDPRMHVGVMKGANDLDAILPRLTSSRVWLLPLLSVVGRHTLEDMAGDAADSWRSRVAASGRECVPVLKGLIECGGLAGLWLRHLAAAAGDGSPGTLLGETPCTEHHG